MPERPAPLVLVATPSEDPPFGTHAAVATAGQRLLAAELSHRLARLGAAVRPLPTVRVDDFQVEMAPSGTLLVVRNHDQPGMMGRIGVVLGDAGVRVSQFHQARHDANGEALALLRLNAPVGDDTVQALQSIPNVQRVQQVQLS